MDEYIISLQEEQQRANNLLNDSNDSNEFKSVESMRSDLNLNQIVRIFNHFFNAGSQ